MNIKIVCFGVRKEEERFFKELNSYGYSLTLIEELLTEDNIDLVKGHTAVLLRGSCNAKANNLIKMKAMGVEYLLTRTAGVDHIDLVKAKELGFKIARVPAYSPNAIAELGLSLAMMLLRHTVDTTFNTRGYDFKIYPSYFSREIRFMTVGIVGTGKIGLTSASLFKGLGAKILGFDPYPNPNAQAVLTYEATLDNLLKASDVVILHSPYVAGTNDNMINAEKLALMKKDAILINMARGEIVDSKAVVASLKDNHLAGFATDVLAGEAKILNHKFDPSKGTGNEVIDELVKLYPRVLITPHLGSNTDEACRNTVGQSFANLHDFIESGSCKNML